MEMFYLDGFKVRSIGSLGATAVADQAINTCVESAGRQRAVCLQFLPEGVTTCRQLERRADHLAIMKT